MWVLFLSNRIVPEPGTGQSGGDCVPGLHECSDRRMPLGRWSLWTRSFKNAMQEDSELSEAVRTGSKTAAVLLEAIDESMTF